MNRLLTLTVAFSLAVTAAFSSVGAASAATVPTFVQGATFSTGTRVFSTTVTLTNAVTQGDLLVGWFSQYDAVDEVQVSDNVNGAWTRAPGGLAFQNDLGD